MIIGIIMIVVGVIVALFFNPKWFEDMPEPSTMLIILFVIISIFSGCIILIDSQQGVLRVDDQKTKMPINEIYETSSSVRVDNGNYAVILRQRDGEFIAYKLKQNPPKVFKKSKNTQNPYQAFDNK